MYCIIFHFYYCIVFHFYYCIVFHFYYCIVFHFYYCIVLHFYYCIVLHFYYCIVLHFYYCIVLHFYYCIIVYSFIIVYYCIVFILLILYLFDNFNITMQLNYILFLLKKNFVHNGKKVINLFFFTTLKIIHKLEYCIYENQKKNFKWPLNKHLLVSDNLPCVDLYSAIRAQRDIKNPKCNKWVELIQRGLPH